VALLVPTAAIAGNKNRFKGDGTGNHNAKKLEVTFRLQNNGKKVEDFRAKDFKFRCDGRKDFKSNWIKFDKKFKVKKKNGKFDGDQKESTSSAQLKGKVKGRLEGKKDDRDEAHGTVRFNVDYFDSTGARTADCTSKRLKWEADR
jgi:hypothetical protein